MEEGMREFYKGDGVRQVVNADYHTYDGVRRIETKEGNDERRGTGESPPMERSRPLPKVGFGST
jgi:hypothetical protein